MFIYEDSNLGIQILPEAMELSEVKDLYASDRTTNKTSWKQWIRYIYFVYKKDGVFSGDLLAQKRKEVVSRYFPEKDVKYFEENKKVRAVAMLWMKKQYTHWELLYEKWKEDVDAYIVYLTDIPYYRKKKVVIQGAEGQPNTETTEDVPNIEEKVKAQKAIQDLVDTGKKLEGMILQEKKEGSSKMKPLFDN